MTYAYLSLEETESIAAITLNRPEKHDALSQELWLNCAMPRFSTETIETGWRNARMKR